MASKTRAGWEFLMGFGTFFLIYTVDRIGHQYFHYEELWNWETSWETANGTHMFRYSLEYPNRWKTPDDELEERVMPTISHLQRVGCVTCTITLANNDVYTIEKVKNKQ